MCQESSSPSPTPSSSSYQLTRRVVSFHNNAQDAWVIVNNSVYDVTLFLEQHPGGASIILPYLGKDITAVLQQKEGGSHLHSAYAYKLLTTMKIGELKTNTGDAAAIAAHGKEETAQDIDGNVDPKTGKLLVRWDMPILPQVGQLGDKYDTWIHSFPTTDHTVKMFQNDILENLTKCPWYYPLVFWGTMIVVILSYYLKTVQFQAVSFSVYAISGYIFWLLFEYSLHRWAFHAHSNSYVGNIIHFLIHGHHHITPLDPERVVFPPIPALLFGSPVWIAAVQLLGFQSGYAFLLGFVLGYLSYDMTHFWMHQGVPKFPFLKEQKKRHTFHHYHQPGVNYGISNPLFDYVFQTYYKPEVV